MMDSATYVVDVERSESCIEVILADGRKEWIYSHPRGDWTRIGLRGVNYADFLRTMVEPNVDVLRKIARMELDQVYPRSIRAMRCLRTLDSSFDVPYINKNSEWQMNMVTYFNKVFGFLAINSCDDQWALTTYANEIRAVR
jgi:hypothetical protein